MYRKVFKALVQYQECIGNLGYKYEEIHAKSFDRYLWMTSKTIKFTSKLFQYWKGGKKRLSALKSHMSEIDWQILGASAKLTSLANFSVHNENIYSIFSSK